MRTQTQYKAGLAVVAVVILSVTSRANTGQPPDEREYVFRISGVGSGGA